MCRRTRAKNRTFRNSFRKYRGRQRNIQNCRENLEYFKKCYEAECNLGYVDLPEGKEKEVSYTVKYLKTVTRTENKDTAAYEVNKACSDNRGFLIDFQITQGYLFQELEDPDKSMSFSPRRIDITAQYAGMKNFLIQPSDTSDGGY